MTPNSKLTKAQKLFIIQAFAEFESPAAIQSMLLKRFRVKVSNQNVWAYQTRYKDEIEKLREEYLKDLNTVAVNHRKMRLLYRQRMIQQILKVADPRLYGSAARLLDGCKQEFDKFETPDDPQSIQEQMSRIAELLTTKDIGYTTDPRYKDN